MLLVKGFFLSIQAAFILKKIRLWLLAEAWGKAAAFHRESVIYLK
jgi:hypothetical protein